MSKPDNLYFHVKPIYINYKQINSTNFIKNLETYLQINYTINKQKDIMILRPVGEVPPKYQTIISDNKSDVVNYYVQKQSLCSIDILIVEIVS